ncbi:MAG TPA: cytochrome c-type biogenesis protein [Aestuariivirgaceae bacterium]|nr:cytochrome c-type biogenesis protein [Aestuariivirgaceae bacterium]
MRRILLVLACLWYAVGAGLAVQPDEVLNDAELEARARAISVDIRCLVCQNQSIDDSDAPLARDLRLLVRERLVAGDSNAEVVDYLVDRYGEFVLLQPRFGLHTLVLWLGPFAILALAALAAVRWRRPAGPGNSGEAALSPDEARRLDDLMKREG